MKLPKASPKMVETFDALAPGPPVERKQMFGYPCAFLNGNLFMGLHGDRMLLRLPEDERVELLRVAGAKVFEPMPGRPMREYIVVPQKMLDSPRTVGKWIERSYAYAKSLKPKKKKAKKTSRG